MGDLNAPALYPDYYFLNYEIPGFPGLFTPGTHVWRCLDHISRAIAQYIVAQPISHGLPAAFQRWERPLPGGTTEQVFTAIDGFVAEEDLILREWNIFIGKGVVIEPTAMIKAPAYIGPGSEIRQGAYLRGNTIVGPKCTIGHNTEVKNSIFMGHTEAGHFAYVGDSILGNYVNLGAGTKLANLPFRTLDGKKEEAFPCFELELDGHMLDSGRSKLGAILGDGVETGCNSTLAPAVFLGKDTWVYPCMYVPKGFYGSRMILKSGARTVLIPKRP